MAESEEELKNLLMKVKEIEKVDLKLNIQKTKIMASGPITSWQIDGETVETMADFIFLGSKITADGDCSCEILYKTVVIQSPSHVQLFVTPMDCSMPGLLVPHCLLEFAQVHVHCIGDAVQLSHSDALFSFCPQFFPSSGTFPMSHPFA